MRQIYDSFSDLCLVDLMSIDHLNLKFLIIVDIHDSVIFYIRFEFFGNFEFSPMDLHICSSSPAIILGQWEVEIKEVGRG